jgi:hypothetical protein
LSDRDPAQLYIILRKNSGLGMNIDVMVPATQIAMISNAGMKRATLKRSGLKI